MTISLHEYDTFRVNHSKEGTEGQQSLAEVIKPYECRNMAWQFIHSHLHVKINVGN